MTKMVKTITTAFKITVLVYAAISFMLSLLILPFVIHGILFGADSFMWKMIWEVIKASATVAIVGFLPSVLLAIVVVQFTPPLSYKVPPPRYPLKPGKPEAECECHEKDKEVGQ